MPPSSLQGLRIKRDLCSRRYQINEAILYAKRCIIESQYYLTDLYELARIYYEDHQFKRALHILYAGPINPLDDTLSTPTPTSTNSPISFQPAFKYLAIRIHIKLKEWDSALWLLKDNPCPRSTSSSSQPCTCLDTDCGLENLHSSFCLLYSVVELNFGSYTRSIQYIKEAIASDPSGLETFLFASKADLLTPDCLHFIAQQFLMHSADIDHFPTLKELCVSITLSQHNDVDLAERQVPLTSPRRLARLLVSGLNPSLFLIRQHALPVSDSLGIDKDFYIRFEVLYSKQPIFSKRGLITVPQHQAHYRDMPTLKKVAMNEEHIAPLQLMYKQMQYFQLLKKTQHLLEHDPFCQDVSYLHVLALTSLSLPGEVFVYCQTLSDLFEKRPPHKRPLPSGGSSHRLVPFTNTVRSINAMLNTTSKKVHLYFALGCYYFLVKNYDASKGYFIRCNKLSHTFTPSIIMHAHCFFLQKEYDHAISLYAIACKFSPGSYFPHLYMHACYYYLNNLEFAYKTLYQLFIQFPSISDPYVYQEMGVVYYQSQHLQGAIYFFQLALRFIQDKNTLYESNVFRATICLNLAHAYRKSQANQHAVYYFDLAYKLDYANAQIPLCMAVCFIYLNLQEKAIEMLHESLLRNPGDILSTSLLHTLLSKTQNDLFIC